MRCFVYAFLLLLATARSTDEDLRRIDSIIQEQECRTAGGMCTVSGDCPKGQLAEKPGLCPQQRKQGIECCYGISLKETRCSKHGGVCRAPGNFCNPKLVFHGAKDCPENHKCCILTF